MSKGSYPFVPKSTAYLKPGHFWSIPLANGRFACGRVVQLAVEEGRRNWREFLAGLLDWVGDSPPSSEAIAGCSTMRQAGVPVRAIRANQGQVLGFRPLEADGIEPWLFLSETPRPDCFLCQGYDRLRPATPEEQQQYAVFPTWNEGVIKLLAEKYFGSRSGWEGSEAQAQQVDLVARLAGPFFDFLVCEKDEYWERCGAGQRINGIKQEYYHHPQALRVPDCVISLVVSCFEEAHPRFNYYGDTEFHGEDLDRLLGKLNLRLDPLRRCASPDQFKGYVTELFEWYCEMDLGSWQEHWPLIRDQVAATIEEVLHRARAAREVGKVLLVLGV